MVLINTEGVSHKAGCSVIINLMRVGPRRGREEEVGGVNTFRASESPAGAPAPLDDAAQRARSIAASQIILLLRSLP